MSEGSAARAVSGLRAAVDVLLGVPVEGLAATELAAVLQAGEGQRRRLGAGGQRVPAAGAAGGGGGAVGEGGGARFEAPRQLRRTAAELLTRLDPDGLEPIEDRAERRRSFTLVTKPDGTSTPRGSWTAEVTALWETVLDSLAAPQPAEEGVP